MQATSPNLQPGRSIGTGSTQSPQAGWSSSPSNGTLATAAPDNCHNSQLGDVAGYARDQGGGPRGTNVPCSSAVLSPDNVTSDARDQWLRPWKHNGGALLQPQL